MSLPRRIESAPSFDAVFDERLEVEIDRAVRYHRPLAIVLVQFADPPEAIAGHVDSLTSHKRRIDLIARCGADEVALVLPEGDRRAAEAVANRAAKLTTLAIQVGIASLPEDRMNATALLGIARARLLGSRAWPGGPMQLAKPALRQIVECVPTRTATFDVKQRVAQVEHDAVVAALDANAGNQTQAAKQLGISRFALIRLMEKHDLKPRSPFAVNR